ncbi:uncharacterized protein LOC121379293 [Gigantopelta aegis]|uniref:uncharacterized protein LOC121379293 n=1 Tax=Gigantopelta aegis TaxID=1735272 RepID=UPI001B88E37F|nr:uncharacterized protein LOC121379293 [Gigantopelta aegis]
MTEKDGDAPGLSLQRKLADIKSTFVFSNWYGVAKRHMDDMGWVTICGAQRSDKTTHALMLADQYYQDGYEVLVEENADSCGLLQPEEWSKPTCLVLDNILQCDNVTAERLQRYFDTLRKLESRVFNAGRFTSDFKLVLTVGIYEFNAHAKQLSEFDNTFFKIPSIVNLSEIHLTKNEENEMLSKHLTHAGIMYPDFPPLYILQEFRRVPWYPYVCRRFAELYHENERFRELGYYDKAMVIKKDICTLVADIRKLFSIDNYETEMKKVALIFLILKGGHIALRVNESQKEEFRCAVPKPLVDASLDQKFRLDNGVEQHTYDPTCDCNLQSTMLGLSVNTYAHVLHTDTDWFNDMIDKDRIEFAHEDLDSVLEQAASTVGLKSFKDSLKTEVLKAFLLFDGTLVSVTTKHVLFNHNVYDAVAYVMSELDQKFAIDYCSMRFISNRLSTDQHTAPFYTHIVLEDDSRSTLIDRLIREIQQGHLASPMSHPSLLNKHLSDDFQYKLFDIHDEIVHCCDKGTGYYFLFWAALRQHGLCVKLLQSAQFGETELLQGCLACCLNGDTQILNLLLEQIPDAEISLEVPIGEFATVHDADKVLRSLSPTDVNKVLFPRENVHYHGYPGSRMIHIASACGHVDVVRCLIQKRCDVDAVCLETEMTPLMFASNRGHLKVVELLVENRADILRVNKENDYGLHLACRANHEDIVRFFLNGEMHVDCRGEHGRTLIMFACRFGYERLVSFLLSKNPDVYAIPRKDYNHNCLHLACIKGSVTIVQALFDYGMDIDVISDDQVRTPVMFACRHGQLQVVQLLMQCEANMTTVDNDGLTCLHLAAMNGNVDLIELLVSMVGLGIDCQSDRGITALMSAASKGFNEAFFWLIKHGSNPYAINRKKETPLHMAARGGSVQISDWLLKKVKTLHVNRKCRRGSSPLDIAMECNHLELVVLFKSWSGHMS